MITQSYGFNPNPSGDVGKGRNKRQADRYLEDDRFHCLVSCLLSLPFNTLIQRVQYPDDREFCFEHPLIFDIFEHIFFSNKKLSIGVAFADHFNPLPLPTMALIVAAVSDLPWSILVMTHLLSIYRLHFACERIRRTELLATSNSPKPLSNRSMTAIS